MTDFAIKRGDRLPAISLTVIPAQSLIGATAVFNMRKKDAAQKLIVTRGAATIAGDVLSYAWRATDTDKEGDYEAEFEVIYADGLSQTFPAATYLAVTITADIA